MFFLVFEDGVPRLTLTLFAVFLFCRSRPLSSWYGISSQHDKECVCSGIVQFDEDVNKAGTRDTI